MGRIGKTLLHLNDIVQRSYVTTACAHRGAQAQMTGIMPHRGFRLPPATLWCGKVL